jgi:hypothetical protein
MSITSAQGYEMRIARTGDKIADPPSHIGKPSNGYWQIGASIM